MPARAKEWGNAENRYVPSRTVLAKDREKVAANLGNVNLEQTFVFLALWEHRKDCVLRRVGKTTQNKK